MQHVKPSLYPQNLLTTSEVPKTSAPWREAETCLPNRPLQKSKSGPSCPPERHRNTGASPFESRMSFFWMSFCKRRNSGSEILLPPLESSGSPGARDPEPPEPPEGPAQAQHQRVDHHGLRALPGIGRVVVEAPKQRGHHVIPIRLKCPSLCHCVTVC